MYPRLTRGEYWLLETPVREHVTLSILTSPHLGEVLNKRPHAVTRENLIDDLARLFGERVIVAETRDETDFFPTRPQVEQLLNEENMEAGGAIYMHPSFRLTEKGGALWEAFASPDWECFVADEYFGTENGEPNASFCCPDLLRLEWYFQSLRFPRDSAARAPHVPPLRVEWDTVAPWRATYWKMLPHAHRVRAWLEEETHISFVQNWDVFQKLKRGWYRWGG